MNGASTAPLYMNSDFKVRSSLASYTPSDDSFPTNPWCISTDMIRAARYDFLVYLRLGTLQHKKCQSLSRSKPVYAILSSITDSV